MIQIIRPCVVVGVPHPRAFCAMWQPSQQWGIIGRFYKRGVVGMWGLWGIMFVIK
ncbi:hypothetical protein HanRHA438_Chr02g0080251 [Helianthus annuus]|nr:hypothetical protein HanRHA438_Chr02g0080251 [Helianthus annuus]